MKILNGRHNGNGSLGRSLTHTILSIPWCCVVSLSIALFTTTGSLIGFFFDELMHDVIPFLVVFHIYGIFRYFRHPEKTRGRTLFLVVTTLLFFVSVGFHFTDLHDDILGYDHDHEEHGHDHY